MKNRIKKGNIRAEGQSMLGKSHSNFSHISVMSTSKKIDKLVAGSRLSPLGHETVRSGKSTYRSRQQHLFRSTDFGAGRGQLNFQSHVKNISRPVDKKTRNLNKTTGVFDLQKDNRQR